MTGRFSSRTTISVRAKHPLGEIRLYCRCFARSLARSLARPSSLDNIPSLWPQGQDSLSPAISHTRNAIYDCRGDGHDILVLYLSPSASMHPSIHRSVRPSVRPTVHHPGRALPSNGREFISQSVGELSLGLLALFPIYIKAERSNTTQRVPAAAGMYIQYRLIAPTTTRAARYRRRVSTFPPWIEDHKTLSESIL